MIIALGIAVASHAIRLFVLDPLLADGRSISSNLQPPGVDTSIAKQLVVESARRDPLSSTVQLTVRSSSAHRVRGFTLVCIQPDRLFGLVRFAAVREEFDIDVAPRGLARVSAPAAPATTFFTIPMEISSLFASSGDAPKLAGAAASRHRTGVQALPEPSPGLPAPPNLRPHPTHSECLLCNCVCAEG